MTKSEAFKAAAKGIAALHEAGGCGAGDAELLFADLMRARERSFDEQVTAIAKSNAELREELAAVSHDRDEAVGEVEKLRADRDRLVARLAAVG